MDGVNCLSIEIIDIECGLLSRFSQKIVARKMADL